LKKHITEPTHEDTECSIGREELEEKIPTTTERLKKMAEQKKVRKEEWKLAFNPNWTMTEPEVIEKVVDDT
jgi:hypothetical protein